VAELIERLRTHIETLATGIGAPIFSGVINESAPAHVEFRVDATKMQVKPDPKVDAKTQSEIQRDMQEKVLESARFHEILFRSSRWARPFLGSCLRLKWLPSLLASET
jgi:hypothetical protein